MKLKIFITTTLYLSWTLQAFSQNNFSPTYEVSQKSLSTGINNLIKTIITRDDRLTLSINNLRFSSNQDGKFMCTIKVTTYGIDPNTSSKTTSYFDAVLSEPVVIEANKDFKVGFDLIKGDIELSNTETIKVEINLIKFNPAQENIFARFLKSSMNVISKGNTQIENILSVLEIDKTQKEQAIKFEINYYLPQSFAEFFNLGDHKIMNDLFINNTLPNEYPSQSDGTPFLFNNVPVYIGINHKFNNDGNIASFGKDLINQFTSWVVGQKALKKNDRDNINVNGYISLSFSKDYTTPLPLALKNLINEIETIAKRPSSNIDFNKAQSTLTKLDNALTVFEDKTVAPRLRQNLILFVDILNIYLRYKQMNSGSIDIDREGRIRETIGHFSNFFQSTYLYNSSAGLINLGASGYYNPLDPNKNRFATVYIPYGLPNSSTEFVTKVQAELHVFVSNQKRTGSQETKQLINQNIDYISYEK